MFEIGSDEWPGISKLIEECGEVLQICGKLIGTQGHLRHWDGQNLRDSLIDELADLEAAIHFVRMLNHLPNLHIEHRIEKKLKLFCEWHDKQTAEKLK